VDVIIMRTVVRGLLILIVLLAGAGLLIWQVRRPAESPPLPATVAVPPVPAPEPTPEPARPTSVPIIGSDRVILPVAGPDDLTISAAALREAVQLAQRSESTALLVWHRGFIQLEWYGAGTRPSDLLPGGGIQALLPVLLVGIAQNQGLLPDLDSAAARWIPAWSGDERRRIRLRDLVQGSSGLDADWLNADGLNADRPNAATASLAERIRTAPLAADPGSRQAPSWLELQALLMILRQSSGGSIEGLLSTALWQPMGARGGSLSLDQQPDRPDALPLLSCCIQATARDWLRLGLILARDGSLEGNPIVPPAWVTAMRTPLPAARHQGLRLTTVWPNDPVMPFKARERFVEADTLFSAGTGTEPRPAAAKVPEPGSTGGRLYVSPSAALVVLRLGPAVAGWDESVLPNLLARGITVRDAPGRRVPATDGATLPPIERPPPMPKVESMPLPPLSPTPPNP
jgi:CubicO group peptidase (beta-lactamase class C family)